MKRGAPEILRLICSLLWPESFAAQGRTTHSSTWPLLPKLLNSSIDHLAHSTCAKRRCVLPRIHRLPAPGYPRHVSFARQRRTATTSACIRPRRSVHNWRRDAS
eukprot:83909-Pleurochrysis_carterae.AAC.1